jgi:hypothetical protein
MISELAKTLAETAKEIGRQIADAASDFEKGPGKFEVPGRGLEVREANDGPAQDFEKGPGKFEVPGRDLEVRGINDGSAPFDADETRAKLTDSKADMTLGKLERVENWELTSEQREYYKGKLDWTDKQLDKCTIDGDGVLNFKTTNADQEGTTNENGDKYVSKTIEINGIEVKGVFPEFDSAYDATLDKSQYKDTDYSQGKECNKQLKEAIEKNPSLAEQFTDEQLGQIQNGDTPEGYTWHHNEEPGKMQLVKTENHQGARHTGGRNLWGGGR